MKNFLGKIFGNGVKEVTEGVGGLAINIREAIKGKELDPDRLMDLEERRLGLQQKTIDLNIQDSKSNSWFQSNWRPSMGWVCSISMASYFIPQFLMASYLWTKMCLEKNKLIAYPELEAQKYLFELVIALLGLGLMRTYEKNKKINAR